jgi:DNA-binding IscR family transcriptional regulator
MRNDNRLSAALHVLLHLGQDGHAAATSESLAKATDANPVVVRRTLAGLRDRGYVRSEKGHGGGWTLSCDLNAVSLRDVYEALGSPTLCAMGNRTESPSCLVERAVNASLNQAFADAEAALLQRFGEVTLGKLSDQVRSLHGGHKHAHHREGSHA